LRKVHRCCRTIQHSPHWLQWDAPNSPPKLPLGLRRSSPKSNTPIPSPTPLTTPNGIQIQSAVLPQYRCADRQTWDDISVTYRVSALLSYSDRERRATVILIKVNKSTHTTVYNSGLPFPKVARLPYAQLHYVTMAAMTSLRCV